MLLGQSLTLYFFSSKKREEVESGACGLNRTAVTGIRIRCNAIIRHRRMNDLSAKHPEGGGGSRSSRILDFLTM